MSSKITITSADGAVITINLRLAALARTMRESPMHKKRAVKPILPWLLDYAFETAERNKSDIKRIDMEENTRL